MKKIIGVVTAVLLMSGTVFAKGNYNGDIQIQGGFGFDTGSYKIDPAEFSVKSGKFNIAVETWHLFKITDLFSAGFMVNDNIGLGSTTEQTTKVAGSSYTDKDHNGFAFNWSGLIGPAVGISAIDIVKFNVAVGLAFDLSMYFAEDGKSSQSIFGPGIGVDVQAKFFPTKAISPVVGYKFASTFSKSIMYTTTEPKTKTETIDVDSANVLSNVIYAGVSFNW